MLAFFYVSAYVVGLWAPFVAFHWHLHGPSLLQAALALFNAINVLICMWEISLFVHRHHVKRTYEQLRAKWGDRKLPVPMCLFEDITLRQALSLKHWSIIWSTYSLLDPSYSQHTSWGFWVDTGNGIVTLVPTVLLSFGATWDVVDPLVLGVVGIVFNYQMAYGTVIYFSNYCYNEYYKGASTAMVWVVILANVIWIVFPGMWMAACWEIIRTGSLGVLR